MGAHCIRAAGGAPGWTSSDHRFTLCRERHLLSIADRVPVASSTAPVFPPWGTVYSYFRSWEAAGVWVQLQRTVYEKVRTVAGREACPSVVIMDGQSVKTTERGGTRGFDGYKRVKGRKRHILVDTLGLMVANRVEPANRRAGTRLLAGLPPLFPRISTVIADAGHESRRWARELMRQGGWKLLIVKRSQRAFKITDSPGLWSAPSHGSATTVDSARITNTECKRPRLCSNCRDASHAQSARISMTLFKHPLTSIRRQ
jgi:transposase